MTELTSSSDKCVINEIDYVAGVGLIFVGSVGSDVETSLISCVPFVNMRLHYEDEEVDAKANLTFFMNDSAPPGSLGAFKLVLPFEDKSSPLRAVTPELPSWLKLDSLTEKFISLIFPRTNVEFETVFMRQMQRFGPQALRYFVAKQISENFQGYRAYSISAAVVMAYKAVELNNIAFQEEALRHICFHLDRVEECEITWHPRRNREHLVTSLLCVKWHLELGLGKAQQFFETLKSCYDYSANGRFSSYFTLAHNLTLSLLIYCALLRKQDRLADAEKVAKEGMRLFKAAVHDATDNPTLFKELEVPHKAVHFMVVASKNAPDLPVDFDKWIRESLRVRNRAADRLTSAAKAIGAVAIAP